MPVFLVAITQRCIFSLKSEEEETNTTLQSNYPPIKSKLKKDPKCAAFSPLEALLQPLVGLDQSHIREPDLPHPLGAGEQGAERCW